uniref:Sulfotransferase family protein n=1 Tax=Candidatus Kentrum sp. TUN TaxID=2126343 RepID=A0A451A5X0_9GAMM|nr:MAG: hypothetical protein BECKTUN1418F_GA0071002_10348 [Candidatus Kentron sp. TUN]VFK55948.1 MAG: hypothetical protein BECKTUN1418E_GA0071001_10357 [Candidatus Kentron sp. TUN]VFK61445.1 MAG: hypothetical protein BECKTUN1418D_GA0071000_11522 [Candidatus Kentron sp. TUN]
MYQQRTVSLQEVIDRINIGNPAEVSRLILSVSPCRSGTTVMLRVFGAIGIESHYQELKNVLRWQLQDGDAQWQLPQGRNEIVYLKETLGPYTELEALFNPLAVLLQAGFPPEKLQVLIIGRAPLTTWASWSDQWRGKTTPDRFILAYRTTEQVRLQAHQQNLPVTVLVYESIRDNDPETIISNLFTRLDVHFTPMAIKGWSALPPFGSPNSNVVLPEEPPAFFIPDLHTSVENADKLAFFSKAKNIPNLERTEVDKIVNAGVPEIYDAWRIACEENLGVSIKKDQELEEYNSIRT